MFTEKSKLRSVVTFEGLFEAIADERWPADIELVNAVSRLLGGPSTYELYDQYERAVQRKREAMFEKYPQLHCWVLLAYTERCEGASEARWWSEQLEEVNDPDAERDANDAANYWRKRGNAVVYIGRSDDEDFVNGVGRMGPRLVLNYLSLPTPKYPWTVSGRWGVLETERRIERWEEHSRRRFDHALRLPSGL